MHATLWKQTITGDAKAYDQLVRLFYQPLFQYGCRYSRNKELIKDCIQDVFLEVWQKRQQIDSDIPPKPYLMASLRRRIHRVVLADRQVIGPEDSLRDDLFEMEFSVEETFIREESTLQTANRCLQLLKTLPKRQQEVIYLKYFQELSRDEIAEVMKITPQSVSNLIQLALKWLKSYVGSEVSWLIPVLFSFFV
ncbi:RNA polymerase sigma factor [Larkinella rosea]|uniref:Sigma-70 family RNA polymerase sigma factor n=1 Tax=Larkinella rosea TaxID=2025312 RepID=A0A3P1B9E4_9BACT|nr:sigma-70 family RNA polymerase sigma factor [Larkinella rosea]RRA97737.1 sigma-70 family RNA polymerase sigma factor [Larkinella rosea]